MSVYKSCTVYCDTTKGDCVLSEEAWPSDCVQTVSELRRRMKAHGWKSKNGKDYCPNCTPPEQEKG